MPEEIISLIYRTLACSNENANCNRSSKCATPYSIKILSGQKTFLDYFFELGSTEK